MDTGRGVDKGVWDEIKTFEMQRMFPESKIVDMKSAVSTHDLSTTVRFTMGDTVFEGVITDEQLCGGGERSITVVPIAPVLPVLDLDDPDDWYYPGPPEDPTEGKEFDLDTFVKYFDEMFKETRRAFQPIAESFARVFTQSLDALLPHHLVCDHPVKCKPPGAGAAFSPMITKQKRSRSSVAKA